MFVTAADDSGRTDAGVTEWKLTLKDDSQNALALSDAYFTESRLIIPYSGATTGNNEYLSLIVKQTDGAQTRYRAAAITSANGLLEIPRNGMTMNINAGDELYVYSE